MCVFVVVRNVVCSCTVGHWLRSGLRLQKGTILHWVQSFSILVAKATSRPYNCMLKSHFPIINYSRTAASFSLNKGLLERKFHAQQIIFSLF